MTFYRNKFLFFKITSLSKKKKFNNNKYKLIRTKVILLYRITILFKLCKKVCMIYKSKKIILNWRLNIYNNKL